MPLNEAEREWRILRILKAWPHLELTREQAAVVVDLIEKFDLPASGIFEEIAIAPAGSA